MISVPTEERIRRHILDGLSDQTTASLSKVSCATVRKIRRTMTLVGCIDDCLKEQVIMKLCGGYTHRNISDEMKIDTEIVQAISRFCYLRSKQRTARVLVPLCAVCKADINALNDKPCSCVERASDEDIIKEARTMFSVICDIVGLDSLCFIASPIFGAIAKEAGQIKRRVIGEENGKEENETLGGS